MSQLPKITIAGVSQVEVEVTRDRNGLWTHPYIGNICHDEEALAAWLVDWNLEAQRVLLRDEDQNHPASVSYFVNRDSNISAWEPMPPEGEGWSLLSIHDRLNGPEAVFVRSVELPAEETTPCL